MDRTFLAGVALTALGVVGYAVGVAADAGLVAPYPGRELSVTGVMAGIALAAVGSGADDDAAGAPNATDDTTGGTTTATPASETGPGADVYDPDADDPDADPSGGDPSAGHPDGATDADGDRDAGGDRR